MTSLSVSTGNINEKKTIIQKRKTKRKRTISPKTFIKKTIFDKNIVLQKKRKKVKEETFEILRIELFSSLVLNIITLENMVISVK